MKLKSILLGFSFLMTISVLLISARPYHSNDIYNGLQVGEEMPRMKTNDRVLSEFVPKPNSHRYTLVHFWAAYNAESRVQNMMWNNFFSHTLSDKIAFRDVSIDPDNNVYKATIVMDGIDTYLSTCVNNNRDEIIHLYGLTKGPRTYLVNDKGIICAVNPTIEELKKFYLI